MKLFKNLKNVVPNARGGIDVEQDRKKNDGG